MISERNKFIFVHIPKTAGNSIQNILHKYSEDEFLPSGVDEGGYKRQLAVYSNKVGKKVGKHTNLSKIE